MIFAMTVSSLFLRCGDKLRGRPAHYIDLSQATVGKGEFGDVVFAKAEKWPWFAPPNAEFPAAPKRGPRMLKSANRC
jgi:hypothetical protein